MLYRRRARVRRKTLSSSFCKLTLATRAGIITLSPATLLKFLFIVAPVLLLPFPSDAQTLFNSNQRAPILAHPLYPIQVDKRFGIPLQPGRELYTGDIVTFSVDTGSPFDGDDSSITSVLETMHDPAQTFPAPLVQCTPPSFVQIREGGPPGPPPSPFPTSNPYGPGAGPEYSPTTQGYGYQASTQPSPNTRVRNVWMPTLQQMFVVNVVEGRLGYFTLSPLLARPNVPKYIGALPAVQRSGLTSSIATSGDSFSVVDEHLAARTFLPPADPMQMAVQLMVFSEPVTGAQGGGGGKLYGYSFGDSSEFGEQPVGVQRAFVKVSFRPSFFHDYARCVGPHLMATYMGVEQVSMSPKSAVMPPSQFRIDIIPAEVARRLLDLYQSSLMGALPRPFFLMSMLPFVSRIDGVHFHGVEAAISSREIALGRIRVSARGTRLEQQLTLSLRNRVTDNLRFSIDVGIQLQFGVGISAVPVAGAQQILLGDVLGLAGLNIPALANLPALSLGPLDLVGATLVELLGAVQVGFGYDLDVGLYTEFGGDYTVLCPANTETVGHVHQHIGFANVPFSVDMVRQENYWPAQWIADMQVAPGSMFQGDVPFSDPCLGRTPSFLADDRTWTARSVTLLDNGFSTTNPFSLIHPAMELHHFMITGVYESRNTFFVEFVIERVL